jgi:RNA polymerase sigma factor (sigma-70 family)
VTTGREEGDTNKEREFVTTRWSLVISAGKPEGDEQKAREALAELCRTYWRPIFSFISQRGYSVEDAQDLTQDFLVMIIESNWLEHADASRGRFRSFLLKSLQNFLAHAAEKKRALKRGGNVFFVPLDDWIAEVPSHFTLRQQTLELMQPEQIFDVRWAATVVEHALARLKEECEMGGRRRLFEALNLHLVAERSDISYAQIALSLDVAEAVVKKQLHLLRRRYRRVLRDEVAHTVADPADVNDEIRYLCATLAATAE